MAIVLPQGLLNNTNAEYIRRFIIDEARILAVVGLHVNTFKPHTGTKTSVLFLRKYTDEEKEQIQQIRAKYEGEWGKFLENLKEKYQNLTWDSPVDEEEIPEELNSFLETYFESREEIEELPAEETEVEETEETEKESEGKKPLAVLVQEKSELDEALREKQEELESANATRKAELKKEIKALQNKIDKLTKEISQRTLAGQISLVLNDEKITEAFKKYWLDGKIMQEMDYPIFFAVNEKPVKDESGEYRYKKNPDGSFVLDEHGQPVIDHDLDEIADAFIKFAKEQLAKGDNHFDFWG
jgi:type I restriction enzyme M protein